MLSAPQEGAPQQEGQGQGQGHGGSSIGPLGTDGKPIDGWWFIEATHHAIAIDDVEGQVVYANEAFRKLFRIPDEAPLGRLSDYVAPSHLAEVLARHERRQRGSDEDSQISFRAVRHDGTELEAEGSITIVRTDGRITGTVAVVRDVTAQRQRESETREAEARYRTVFESAFDAMIVFEPKTERILQVNRRACEMYGFSEAEFLGRSLKSLSVNIERGRSAVDTVMSDGTIEGHITTHRRRDDSLLVVDCSASAIDYGGTKAILTVNRDVTERERLAQQLRHAEKMQAVVQLAAGVAHEFNNILATILASAEDLRDLAQDKEVIDILEGMISRSRSGGRVTEGLLTLARPQQLNAAPISIDEILSQMDHPLRRVLPAGVSLEVDPDSDDALAAMQTSDVERVLTNLVINARDALDGAGRIQVTTSIVRQIRSRNTTIGTLGPGEYICLSVADNGSGIGPEQLKRIFEPFYTTKPVGKGTGLGLAEVWAVVEAGRGGVDVHSSTNGTVFEILLPVALDGLRRQPQTNGSLDSCEGLSVLVVDDETNLLEAIVRGLEREGLRVLSALNAEQAQACLCAHPEISVLVTDISLGSDNGIELARGAVSHSPNLGVVLMSGFAHESPADLLNAVFVGKPCSRAELLDAIRSVRPMLREAVSLGQRRARG